MDKKIRNRAALILAVVVVSVLGIAWGKGLSGFPRNFTQLKENLRENVHLGLDLRGGTHLVLEVHVDDAVKVTRDETLDRVGDGLKSKKIPFTDVQPCADPATCSDPQKRDKDITHIYIAGIPQGQAGDLKTMVTDQFSDWDLNQLPGVQAGGTFAYSLVLKPTMVTSIRNQALEQAMTTIGRRINALGVTEPTIAEYGKAEDFELVVELPSVDDPTRVRDIIQSTAFLEWKLVREGPFPSREAALAAHGGILPPDTQLLPGRNLSVGGGPDIWFVVDRIAAITGRDLTGAEPGTGSDGSPSVNFTLTRDGGTRFAQVTGANVGRNLAIVLDSRVQSDPVVESQINERGEITHLQTIQESSDLALLLRSGALPASITTMSEAVVGASLGADSIRHGVIAAIVGFFAIVAFMLIYYRGAGINADLALVLNLVILIAAFVYIAATLTLPGIAGVILTVGMGVDSNVLVFERIREELRQGKTVGSAVEAGFSNAFRTILDTHVTTVVSAAILFAFGTGPIRGFAVTLTIGLVANLFTSVFVSRVIFDWVANRLPKGEALSI
jgi:preprotein translocase subunit SecD